MKTQIAAAIPRVERNPVRGTFGELNFLAGIPAEADTRHDRMLQARTHGRSCLAKIPAGKIFFERSRADGDAIKFHYGAGRRAGNLELVGDGARRTAKQEQDRAKGDLRTGSHQQTSPGP